MQAGGYTHNGIPKTDLLFQQVVHQHQSSHKNYMVYTLCTRSTASAHGGGRLKWAVATQRKIGRPRRAHQLLNLLSSAGGAALACGVRQGALAANGGAIVICAEDDHAVSR